MKAQDLKKSILQLAIQGKLVEQDPNDEPATVLFERIKAEKAALVKAGKIKKDKPLPPITDDEIPFDIPDSWTWVRLGSIMEIARGGSPRPIQNYLTTDKNGLNWIKIGDTDKGGKYINSTKEKIKPEGLKKTRFVHKGDFLLTNSMSFGRPYILNIDGCIHDGWLVISDVFSSYSVDFLYYLLSSSFAYNQFCGKVSGAVVSNLNSDKVATSIFPLPPLTEQKRIVAKIEELEPLIAEYDTAETALTALNTAFPEQMKKSILQQAIQGKLVEQDPNDEPATVLLERIKAEKAALVKAGKIKKDKPLPPITEDEIPFDIPDSWMWVYIGDIFQHNTGKALNGVHGAGKMLPYITTSNLYWNRFELDNLKEMPFTETELEKCTVQKGDLLVCEGGDFGRTAVWSFDMPMRIQNHIHRLRPYADIDVNFYYFVFYLYKSMRLIAGKGIGIQGLSSDRLHNILVPLPPLAEQKRIVAKIEELMLLNFI